MPGSKDPAYGFGAPSQISAIEGVPSEQASEQYTIRKPYLEDLCQLLGLTPTLDCFATDLNVRCPRHLTAEKDSLKSEWLRDEILWLNPP